MKATNTFPIVYEQINGESINCNKCSNNVVYKNELNNKPDDWR